MTGYLAEQLRKEDRDRYLTAQFAPEPARADLMALYAFNVEVAKIRESVSESLIGAIRLQWWRDQIDAFYAGTVAARGNPVAEALREIIVRHRLSQEHFRALLDARARDMEGTSPIDMADLEAYAEGTSSRLVWLALEVLDARDSASFTAGGHVGIAWALTGVLRAVLFHARESRVLLPTDAMTDAGLGPQDLLQRRNSERIAAMVSAIAKTAEQHLSSARAVRGVDQRAIPALLPATLADGYLRGFARRRYDVFDPRHALQRPAITRLVWNAIRRRY